MKTRESVADNNKKSDKNKCAVKNCKKMLLKNSEDTLFFRFPLKKKLLLKKWTKIINLSNWQPSKIDNICSDHFEHHDIIKIGSNYKLNKNAYPSIKPKKPFVMNSGDLNQISGIPSYNNLEYNQVDDNTLRIHVESENDQKRKVDYNTNNVYKTSQIPNEAATTQLNSTEKYFNEENKESHFPNQLNDSFIENSLLDNILDCSNISEELQPKKNATKSLIKHYLELFVKEIAKDELSAQNMVECSSTKIINCENIPSELPFSKSCITTSATSNQIQNLPIQKTPETKIVGDKVGQQSRMESSPISIINCENNLSGIVFSTSCVDNTLLTPITSNPCQNVPNEKTMETKIVEVNDMLPKSINIGNLNTLNGDDGDENLSFEKQCTSISSKINVPEQIEKSPTIGIPKTILYCEELTESYGKMISSSCEEDCDYDCFHAVPGPQRRYVFEEFHILNDVTKQNCKIAQLVQFRNIEMDDNTFESCPFFCLTVNGVWVKVCRLFFSNTLGITNRRLNAILNPINYSWYSDKDTALKANPPNKIKIISEPMEMTDFVKGSLKPLNKDYNSFESESDSEVSLDDVSVEERKKIILYLKSIPRILCSVEVNECSEKQLVETSICMDYIFKTYSEMYLQHNTRPPCTKRQFRKMYNHYMLPYWKT